VSSERWLRTGPNEKVKKILIAALDENNKPIFTTLVSGSLQVNVESEREEVRSFRHDMVVSSWDVPSEYEFIVRGRPVEQ
jgi:hypothetical protein